MMRTLLLLLLTLHGATYLSAQVSNTQDRPANPIGLIHVDQFLESARFADGTPDTRALTLLKDAHPSVYVENEVVKTFGDNPIRLFTDVRSFIGLSNLVPRFQDVEIITVRVVDRGELASVLDLLSVAEFPNLRYVYILVETPATAAQVAQMVRIGSPKFTVFYNIALTR